MSYTPTTEAIRCYWSLGCTMELWSQRRKDAEAQYGEEFDRWLADHEAEIRADERAKIAAKIRAIDPVEWALAGQDAGRHPRQHHRGPVMRDTEPCLEARQTSQGIAVCHQPAHHHGADHLGYLTDTDGQQWLVTWWGSHTELQPRGNTNA